MSRMYQFENANGWFLINLDAITAITDNHEWVKLGPTKVWTGSKHFEVSLTRDQVRDLIRDYEQPKPAK